MNTAINIVIFLNAVGIILAVGLGIFLRIRSSGSYHVAVKVTSGSIRGNINDKALFSFVITFSPKEQHMIKEQGPALKSERSDFKTTYVYEKDNYLACQ